MALQVYLAEETLAGIGPECQLGQIMFFQLGRLDGQSVFQSMQAEGWDI